VSLHAWRRDIEAELGIVMRHARCADLSPNARKAWAREYIRQLFPHWVPGNRLTADEYIRLGIAFNARLRAAQRGGHARG
jgi:hypothetical protein